MSELKTIVVDGVKYVEVRDEAKAETPKFKVGDLAKVVGGKVPSHYGFNSGETVKISAIRDFEKYPFIVNKLSDNRACELSSEELEPYTPQAGDVLTVDGVEYRLVERKAEVGEKVIVIKNENDHTADINEIATVDYSGEYDIHLGRTSTYMDEEEYLVLVPASDEKKPSKLSVELKFNAEKFRESLIEAINEAIEVVR
jgi:methyl coenzyme M reductase subunit D